ncbi:MAG: type II toxin-antitoxin system prevent-host-death family antitoxin [Patescibacteria group bacterium]
MTNTISVSQLRNDISEYLNRVRYNNDVLIVKKGNTPVAKIIAIDSSPSTNWPNDYLKLLKNPWANSDSVKYLKNQRATWE